MTVQKYKKEEIEKAVKESLSWRQVIKKLNPNANYRGSESNLKKRAIALNIDFSHFPGQSWNKGKKFPPKNSIEEYFNGKFISSNELKKRLIKEGLKQSKCEVCNLFQWQGKNIPLELHHINHNPKDNTLINLKIVCANCHYNEHNVNILEKKSIRKNKAKQKRKNKAKNKCLICENPAINKYCSYTCMYKGLEKVDKPSQEELEKLTREIGFSATGRKFGVSDNTIRKWLSSYKK